MKELVTAIEKNVLDKLVNIYETPEFIKDDPVQFPHKFSTKKDIEIAGFIASLLAYGNRKVFIKKLDTLFEIAQNEPLNFILNFEAKILGDFNYRFGTTEDFVQIFSIMRQLYNQDGGLEELFKNGYNVANKNTEIVNPSINMFIPICDYFYSKFTPETQNGQKFMIPNPQNGGAMKRMCMFLRWMIRKGPVDLGIWDFMKPSELFIPLDTHVARISRKIGILTRNSNDFKSVIEITENLRELDPQDPIKYDFALFGYGVNNN
jgi:uncharacterized protein (TIGR02757 family)